MENGRKNCRLDPSSGVMVCVDPEICEAPAAWVCADRGPMSCTCQLLPAKPPVQGPLCTASLVYPASTPAAVSLVPMEPWCEAAGVELAIAVLLARLLGAPR